jgi:tRNA-dihydrouridine synthase 1
MPGDIDRCMAETGVDGVMSAEGILSNPRLLFGEIPYSWDVASEYLDFAERYDAPFSAIRAHLFRICHYRFHLTVIL